MTKATEKKCNWKFTGCHPHNGEYWHRCETCGATDWVAHYGNIEDVGCKAKKTRAKPKPRVTKVTFARAVYCPNVDTWYVRLGKKHGIDIMYAERTEDSAKRKARLINESLNRDLAKKLQK